MKKLLNSWINRTLTIYGKAVIKTLAMPKLTHLALVLPNLNEKKMKQIENLFFSFLWNNKPDKVCRDDAKLSEKAGGLGIMDIKTFWKSLMFSWLRRCYNTRAVWPTILCLNVKPIINQELSISDLLQLGPKMLEKIGKKFTNIFWKQVFCSVFLFMQGALFCYPEKLPMSPFWDNPSILQNNRPIKKTSFPNISTKIYTLSDFFVPGSCQMFSRDELENRYNTQISSDDFVEIKYIIKLAFRSLGLKDDHGICTFLPSQPLLINILNLSKSGCSLYSRLLKKKSNLGRTIKKSEIKWHTELGCTFGIDFWNKTYSLTSDIKGENKLKWFQFQINRNSLFTNYRVSKFKPGISPYCSHCPNLDGVPPNLELISHLFFECDLVLNLWQQVKNWLVSLNICLEMNRNKLLFGVQSEPGNSVKNFIILTVKYYIWKAKFQQGTLNLSDYQKYLKYKLEDFKNACQYEDKDMKFDKWLVIFDNLTRSCTGTSNNEAPLPDTADPQALAMDGLTPTDQVAMDRPTLTDLAMSRLTLTDQQTVGPPQQPQVAADQQQTLP